MSLSELARATFRVPAFLLHFVFHSIISCQALETLFINHSSLSSHHQNALLWTLSNPSGKLVCRITHHVQEEVKPRLRGSISDCSYPMAMWPVVDKNSDDYKQVIFWTTGTSKSFDVELNKWRYRIKSREYDCSGK